MSVLYIESTDFMIMRPFVWPAISGTNSFQKQFGMALWAPIPANSVFVFSRLPILLPPSLKCYCHYHKTTVTMRIPSFESSRREVCLAPAVSSLFAVHKITFDKFYFHGHSPLLPKVSGFTVSNSMKLKTRLAAVKAQVISVSVSDHLFHKLIRKQQAVNRNQSIVQSCSI